MIRRVCHFLMDMKDLILQDSFDLHMFYVPEDFTVKCYWVLFSWGNKSMVAPTDTHAHTSLFDLFRFSRALHMYQCNCHFLQAKVLRLPHSYSSACARPHEMWSSCWQGQQPPKMLKRIWYKLGFRESMM